MKRTATKRAARRHRLPAAVVAQIKEMLRLTPTERLEKAWRYTAKVFEIQRVAGLKDEELPVTLDEKWLKEHLPLIERKP